MLEFLIAFVLVHHNEGSPYGWHMSCERFLQRQIEILTDDNLDYRSQRSLIGYLRTKVEEECSGTFT